MIMSSHQPWANNETETLTSGNRSPAADQSRIASDLRAINQFGIDPSGGISRLAFTSGEREAHSLVSGYLRALGMEIHTDSIGNTFATRQGQVADAPAIAVGSHLDSVPHGGEFDGVVGVVGAIELVRMLVRTGQQLDHSLVVAVFAGEEGARFGLPSIGSKAVTGALTNEHLSQLRDENGVMLSEAILQVGLDPGRLDAARWDARKVAVFLEMHIEQARVLESERQSIGLVDVVSGSTRLRMQVKGQSEHSGGTPMEMRRDALVTASEIVLAIESLATDSRHRGARATVGYFRVHPNSTTTIPGRVILTVDVRDVDTDRQRATAMQIAERAHWICQRRGVMLEIEVTSDTSPAILPVWLRDLVGRTCQDMGVPFKTMSSGAGHDAAIVSREVPSGLIFIPCRHGLSHVPEEWASVADIARGTEVLYHAVLKLDKVLSSWQEDAA